MKVLSEWTGWIVGTAYRCGIGMAELAQASRISDSYLTRYLNEKIPPYKMSREKIEAGLRSCVERRGVRFEDVFPAGEERPG